MRYIKYIFCITLIILIQQTSSFSQNLSVSFTFRPNNACSGTEISFDTLDIIGGTPPFIFEWNFNDGNSSNIANPIHIFNTFGCNNKDFTVTLTVTDTTGGGNFQGSHSEIVTVKRRPNPQLNELLNTPPFSNCYNNPPPTPTNPDFTIKVNNNTNNTYCIVPDSYAINWGDNSTPQTGLTASDFPIEYTYNQLGAFSLKFSCMGTNGCQGSTIHVVKNESNPACGVNSPGQTQGCAPIIFSFNLGENFVNNSPYTEYEWNFGDGSTHIFWNQQTALDSNGTIHHTFTESSCPYGGDFVVVVTATNSCSSTEGTVDGVVVWATAEVLLDTTIGGCVGEEVNFSNWSTNGYGPGCITSTEYTWNFDNGNTYTGFSPPPQIYNQSGIYNVTITGTNYCGTNTFNWPFLILEPPTADATAEPIYGCVGDEYIVSFQNSSLGDSLKYLWTVEPDSGYNFVQNTDSSSKDPFIHFHEYDSYNITLKTYNVCDSAFINFIINANDIPYAEFQQETIITCDSPFIYNVTPNDIIYYDHGSEITNYDWNFPGATPISSSDTFPSNIVYLNSGDFEVTLIIENECGTDTSYQQIEIITQVDPIITPDTAVCENSPSFQLYAYPNIGSWSGEIVDTDGWVSTTEIGEFLIHYTGECLIPDSLTITINPLPEIQILTPDTGLCVYDSPIELDALPENGLWQGTGISNTQEGIFDPNLSGSGLFEIFYYYSDTFPDCICTNNESIFITVDSKPEPNFLPEDTVFCSGIEYTFYNNTQGGNNNQIFWEFSDGFISNLTNQVNHIFDTTGFYIIKLMAVSLYGCEDSISRNIQIIEPPPDPFFNLSFEPVNLCSPVDVTINFNTMIYDDFVSYFWDFGNGTTLLSDISFSDTTITYYKGIVDTVYIISVDVINQCGILTYEDSIFVYSEPIAKFGQDFNWNCSPKPINFINKSLGIIDSIYWNFGDDKDTTIYLPQMDEVIKHNFYTENNDTTYQITMITYNNCGTDTVYDSVTVFPNTIKAFFNTDTTFGCSPLTVHFTNYSSPHTLHYTWAIINNEDTLKYIDYNFLYTFYNEEQVSDTFSVQLWIDDNCSRDTAYAEIRVYPQPELNFIMSTDEICAHENVVFENLSDVADLKWDFGDGTIFFPISDIITHSYSQSGEYQVSLIGRSTDYQCWDTISKTILIKPTPEAYIFTNQTVACVPFTVYFETDSSFNHIWDFGDQSQISINPIHTYINPGYYTVKMISEFENYCTDTAFIEIRVLPKPNSDFSIISLGGYPEKINLENKSIDAINCEWILPNNETINSCESVQIEFDNIGIFSIKLVTWNQYNCPDTCTKEHEVYFKGLFIPNAFSPNNPSEEIRVFKAVGIGLKEYHLQIYDTYSNKIWETNLLIDSKPAEGWNGKYNEKQLQQDVYIWRADAIFLDNTIWQGMDDGTGKLKKYGTVTLIR